MPTKPPAQPQRTQSAEGFLASEENRTGLARTSTLTWQAMCEFAEAYAQSLKQAAAPQAESPKDEVDYNECCCADGYKMICPQHGAPQTLAVGHGVEMADDCAHRALDRLGVPRDGKGLYLRMQWLKAQKEELKTALGQARDYVVGLSAYLATCATATIIENLETTITSLHKERDYLERLLSGDGKE